MSPAAMHLGQTSNLIQIIRKGRSPIALGVGRGEKLPVVMRLLTHPLGLLYLGSGSQEFTA